MVNGPDVVRPARGTRPANRRQLIVDAATDLFYRKGYANVGMGEVADAVAIGPSALYRHFRGKGGLLATVVHAALQSFDDAIAAAADEPEAVATAMAATVIGGRSAGVLWRREARHLEDSDRAAFRVQARGIGARLAGIIAERRPELVAAQCDLLAWAALSVGNSVSFHHLSLPEPDFTELLAGLIRAVLDAPVPELGTPIPDADRRTPLVSRSRREVILTEATRLFAERGFTGVSVDDIGAGVGIAGPSVYNHFPGKADILTAAIFRGDEWLRIDLHRALAKAADPRDALRRLLDGYGTFVFENPHLTQILISEAQHLPDAEQQRARLTQRAYIAEWVHLLREVHPAWDPISARIRVQAAQTVCNDMALTPHLRNLPNIEAASTVIGAAILAIADATAR
ncbi:TetR/AcrR family transcriptional regulator [Nocardia heshunensis]